MSANAIFADKPLSDEHKTELRRIGIMISLWTNAYRSKEGLDQQAERLSAFEVAEPYTFKPPPTRRLTSVLLSMTRCYWLAVVNSLSAQQKPQLSTYLNAMPSFRDEPMFDGKRVVENASSLTEKEYERLMRTAIFVLAVLNAEMAEWWRQLSEMGAVNWPEGDDDDEDADEVDDEEMGEIDEEEGEEGEWEDVHD